jgi:hypothetical protein
MRKTEGQTIAMKQMQAMRKSGAKRIGSYNTAVLNFSHTESIAGVVGNGGGTAEPAIYNYQLNPGLRAVLPWGGSVVYNFQYYKILKMTFRLVSTCASTSTGRWAIACDYNPYYDVTEVTNIDYMLQLNGRQGDVKDHVLYVIVPSMNKKNLSSGLLVRGGDISPDDDLREYDLGNLYIGIESTNTDQLGNLEVTYTIQLRDARPNIVSLSLNGYSTASPTSSGTLFAPQYYLDNSVNRPANYTNYFNEFGNNGGFMFNCNYKGLLELYVNGTGLMNLSYSTDEENDAPFLVTQSEDVPNTTATVYFIRVTGTTTDVVSQWWVNASAGDTVQFVTNKLLTVNLIRLWLNTATNNLAGNSSNVLGSTNNVKKYGFRPIKKLPGMQMKLEAEIEALRTEIHANDTDAKEINADIDCHQSIIRASQPDNDEIISMSSTRSFKEKDKEPKLFQRPQQGITSRIKGGSTDENACWYFIIFFVWCLTAQIIPPSTRVPTSPTTIKPTRQPSVLPTDSPTTQAPTYVYYRSSAIFATGTNDLPLTNVDDYVNPIHARMFSRINGTAFSLNHNGLVLVTLFTQSLSGDLDTPAYKFRAAPNSHIYENYITVTTCSIDTQMSMQLLNMTYGAPMVVMDKQPATTGGTGLFTIGFFTPVDGYIDLTGSDYTSACVSGCSVA